MRTLKKKTFYWPSSGKKAYVVSLSKGTAPFSYEVEEDKLHDFHKSYFRDLKSAEACFDSLCDYLSWVTK